MENGRVQEKKVKGTMLVDQVRMIRKFKHLDWSEYINQEEWKIINSNIMDASWYPLELYRRFGYATYKVLARGNVDLVRMRGRARGEELFTGVYKDIIANNDPLKSLKKFTSRYDILFNFSSLTLKVIEEKNVNLHHEYSAKDPSNVPYCYQLMGHLDTLLEMAGANSPMVEITNKQWQGDPTTIFDIAWE